MNNDSTIMIKMKEVLMDAILPDILDDDTRAAFIKMARKMSLDQIKEIEKKMEILKAEALNKWLDQKNKEALEV